MHDPAHSGYLSGGDPFINEKTVGSLAPQWIVRAPDTISAQAIAANGLIYWGSWDGFEHASKPSTGEDVWKIYLGDETKENCAPPHLGVASTATVDTQTIEGKKRSVLYVGGGRGSYFALDALTGEKIWEKNFGLPENGYFSWSSPVLNKGSMYIGIASIGDCPLVPGALVKLNAATGEQEASFATTEPGCTGATIWSTPTIDKTSGFVYATTGTDGGGVSCGKPEPYAQAVLQFSANLKLLAAWRPPGSEQVSDGDFGATPTLFSSTIKGKRTLLVGAANKSGVYYAFLRGHVERGPVWKTEPNSTIFTTIASTAWDGTRLYLAGWKATIEGKECNGNIRAIDPATGAYVWSACLNGGQGEGAMTAIPGVVFEGMGSIFYALNSATGEVLFKYQDTSFHWFYSPAMVSNGAIYIGNSDSNFYKFTVEGKEPKPAGKSGKSAIRQRARLRGALREPRVRRERGVAHRRVRVREPRAPRVAHARGGRAQL